MKDVQYFEILSYILGALALCVFMLLCGHFLGGRSSSSRSKNIPFESGITSVGSARIKFSIKFYLVAMVFVIFDVEGMYLYVWSVSVRETNWIGFLEVCIFIFILLMGLMYLMHLGVFNWINLSSRYDINHTNSLNIDVSKFLKK